MFCPNCGAKLKNQIYVKDVLLTNGTEELQETISNNPNVEANGDNIETGARDEVIGLCPHCAQPITRHLDEVQIKKLNQVSHAKFHSARNQWNTGMCGLVGGAILLAIALIFFVLCFKVADNFAFSTQGEPFIVFVALSAISLACFVFGSIFVGIANYRKKVYSNLIKNIQNRTFVQ